LGLALLIPPGLGRRMFFFPKLPFFPKIILEKKIWRSIFQVRPFLEIGFPNWGGERFPTTDWDRRINQIGG